MFGTPSTPEAQSPFWKYKHGSITLNSPTQLSPEQQAAWAQQNIDSGLYDEKADERQALHRSDLVGNEVLKSSYRMYYKKEHGADFDGTDEELIDDYYRQMRMFDSNLERSGRLAMLLLGDYYTPEERIALKNMYQTWDNTVSGFQETIESADFGNLVENPEQFWEDLNLKATGQTISDHLVANVTDPFNYLSLALGGVTAKTALGQGIKANLRSLAMKAAEKVSVTQAAGQVGGEAAVQMATKEAMQDAVKGGLGKAVSDAARSGAFANMSENVLQGMAFSGANQGIDYQLGMRDDGSLLESVGEGLASGVAGGVIGGGVGAAAGALQHSMVSGQAVKEASDALAGVAAPAEQGVKIKSNRPKQWNPKDALKFSDEARQDLVAAETRFKEAVAANEPNVGALRKEIRDKASAYYRDTIGQYILDADKKAPFKTNKRQSTAIQSLVSGDGLVDFLGRMGVTTEDNFYTIYEKVLSKTPEGKAVGVMQESGEKSFVSDRVQHMAVLNGLHNSAWETLADPEAHLKGVDIHRLGLLHLNSAVKLQQYKSEAGYMQRLSQEVNIKTGLPDIGFGIEDLNTLTMAEQIQLIDVYRRAGNPTNGMNALNEYAKLTKPLAEKGTKYNFTRALNGAFAHNLLNNFNIIVQNTAGIAMHPFSIASQLLGATATGDKKAVQFSLAEMKALTDVTNLTAAAKDVWDTFTKSKPHAVRSMYNDASALNQYGSLDFSTLKTLGESLMYGEEDATLFKGKAGNKFQQGATIAYNTLKMLDKMVSERLMITSDEVITQMSTRNYVFADTYTRLINEGVDAERAFKVASDDARMQTFRFVQENISHDRPTHVKPPSEAYGKGEDYAKYVTFRNDLQNGLDVGALGNAVQRVKKWTDSGSDELSTALGKAVISTAITHVMPFVRTPMNILNFNLEMTPMLSYASKRFRNVLENGSDVEKARAMGVLSFGSMLWGLALDQAFKGNLTGGQREGTYSRTEIAKGGMYPRVKENTWTIGGNTFSLNSLSPFFFQAKVMADVSDIFRYGGPELGQHASAGLIAIMGNQLLDMAEEVPGMTGLRNISAHISNFNLEDDKKMDRAGQAFAKEVVRNIPFYGLIHQITREDTKREAYDFITEFKRSIPFFNSEELGYDRDPISGEIVQYPRASALDVVPFLPGKREAYVDQVNKEIMQSGLDVKQISPMVKGLDLRAYKHPETGRPMYDRLQELVGTERMPYGKYHGMTLHEALSKLVKSPEYIESNSQEAYYPALSAPDDTNIAKPPTHRQAMLMYVIEEYRDLARATIDKEVEALYHKGDNEATRLMNDLMEVEKIKRQTSAIQAF